MYSPPSAMRVLGASLSLTFSLGAASAAESAATLSRLKGSGVVSQGAHYVSAHEGMVLRGGDRFMVMEGGNAVIRFADGCQYPLADSEILSIGATSSCAAGVAGSYKMAPYSAVARNSSTAASVQLAWAIGAETVPSVPSIPSWAIPAGFAGTLAVLGATLDTGAIPPPVPLAAVPDGSDHDLVGGTLSP